jgi:hypothetical protein
VGCLNRGGDRQLNRALHTIVVARLRDDPSTRAYATRCRAAGKSVRDIRRCLKRAVARQLFKLLEHAEIEETTPSPPSDAHRSGICHAARNDPGTVANQDDLQQPQADNGR